MQRPLSLAFTIAAGVACFSEAFSPLQANRISDVAQYVSNKHATSVPGSSANVPAPLQWVTSSVSECVLVSNDLASKSLVLPQKLIIGNSRGSTPPNTIPYFTANLDGTISWDAMGGRTCIEASGDRSGDAVRINHCTGGPEQKWNWLPSDRGLERVRLAGTTKCLHVLDPNGRFDGAPIALRECEQKVTDSWKFGDSLPQPNRDPARRHALLQYTAVTFVAMMLGALAWRGWLRWEQKKAYVLAVSQCGMPLCAGHACVPVVMTMDEHRNGAILTSGIDTNGQNTAHVEDDVPAPLARDHSWFTIREMAQSDIGTTARLLIDTFNPPERYNVVQRGLVFVQLSFELRSRFKQNVFFVATVQDKIVGFVEIWTPDLQLSMMKRPNPMMKSMLKPYVSALAVSKSVQRQGVGNSLMQAVEEEARKRKWPALVLEVEESNVTATSLYIARDYKVYKRDTNGRILDGDMIFGRSRRVTKLWLEKLLDASAESGVTEAQQKCLES